MTEAPGTIQARNRIAIASQINGFAATVKAGGGHTVGAGQIPATLDARDAESQKDAVQGMISEAQAALELARLLKEQHGTAIVVMHVQDSNSCLTSREASWSR